MTDQEFEKFQITFKENSSCLDFSIYEQLTGDQLSKILNGFEMSPEQKESQRRSFVYGTTKLSNSKITEELVNEIGEKLCQK